MGLAARSWLEQKYSVDSWAPAFVKAVAGERTVAPIEPMSNATAKPKGMAARELRRASELHPPSQTFLTSP
jgi:hypothetical protein